LQEKFVMALDAMGGDEAPDSVIEGAALALNDYPELRYIFTGAEDRIKPLLDKYPKLLKVSEILHTDEKVLSDDKPSAALRQRKNSSMNLAVQAVAGGDASCVVSAGNTGALMLMALFGLKPLPNVSRPAIASYYPTMQKGRKTVLLDLGANVYCTPQNLTEFAVLGGIFAQVVLKVENPKIALLNVGSEEMKGSEEVRDAAHLLAEMTLPGEFTGFVEGDDIMKGVVDVVVTDGFTGNVTLKASEGTARLVAHMMKEAFSHSMLGWLGYPFMIPALRKLKHSMDPRRYNGGVFMGLRGLCVKSHGGMDAVGFANAVCVGAKMIRGDLNGRLAEALEKNTLSEDAKNMA